MKFFAPTFSALLLNAVLANGPAQAAPYDGNDLYDACTAQKSDAFFDQKSAYCLGYVVATAGHLGSLGHSCHNQGNRTASLGEVRDAIIGYIKSHPESRKLDADQATYQALTNAYPCN
ncbi:Rap1a/Tai family immunity protein [Kiloniella laminariae]|uniref:Rap1a/Tai family immunity protein n=1 Tax=Kiloniella laminariae TaxID=454162 RepID=A0ABT4LFC9_9PROT|nr:Rap1a/Tai family immunity protein [Kiloniella laminariae]MCZ4279789.1 Rap1a/Tai family immunity protein [Kiloniella laminariae]